MRERTRSVAASLGRLLRRGNSGPREIVIVLIVSLVLAAPAWLVASAIAGPVREIAALGECGRFASASAPWHACTSGLAAGTLVLPAIWLFVLFRARAWLAGRVRAAMGIAPDLRYLALPTVGTLAFLVPWAFIHADTGARVGLVPQWAFPALVATIAHALHRYGPEVRGSLAEFFARRDRLPRRTRSALGIGVPLAFAVAVASEPGVGSATLKEQVVALVSLACGYLAIAPPLGRLAGALGSAFDDIRPPTAVTSRANAFTALLRALVTRGAPGALFLLVLDAGRAYACHTHASCESAPGYSVVIGVAGGVMALTTTALAGDVTFQSLLASDARQAKSGTRTHSWLPGAPAIPWLPLGGLAIGTALILGICRAAAPAAVQPDAPAAPTATGAIELRLGIAASFAVVDPEGIVPPRNPETRAGFGVSLHDFSPARQPFADPPIFRGDITTARGKREFEVTGGLRLDLTTGTTRPITEAEMRSCCEGTPASHHVTVYITEPGDTSPVTLTIREVVLPRGYTLDNLSQLPQSKTMPR